MKVAFTILETLGYRLVSVLGDIDGANAHAFGLACTCSRPVVIDLRNCTFLDSSGLNVLGALGRSGEVALVLRPDCRIYRIFEITGLVKHLTLATTVAEAADLVRAPSIAP